jgi:hypothetical protein
VADLKVNQGLSDLALIVALNVVTDSDVAEPPQVDWFVGGR